MTNDAMDDFVARLGRVDACAVSDALDTLGLPGAASGIHRLATSQRVWGQVITVKLERAGAQAASTRHLATTAIDHAKPGEVIVIEQRSGVEAAAWGGNLSLGAKLRGVAGVIIDGPARDLDEAQAHDFPVFARSATVLTARGRIVETGTNLPVTIADVPVLPGDYVVADGSGVVFVAHRDIEQVLEAAEAIVTRERAMVAAIRQGTPIGQVMGRTYEQMLKR